MQIARAAQAFQCIGASSTSGDVQAQMVFCDMCAAAAIHGIAFPVLVHPAQCVPTSHPHVPSGETSALSWNEPYFGSVPNGTVLCCEVFLREYSSGTYRLLIAMDLHVWLERIEN